MGPTWQGLTVEGTWHPRFERVVQTLARVLSSPRRGGAALAVYHRGSCVVDAWAGDRDDEGTSWRPDDVAPSFSTTKGVVSVAAHMLVDRGRLSYDMPVAEVWPEFAAAGKETVTVGHLLSHESGLHPIRPLVASAFEMTDWRDMCRRLAAAAPAFPPGRANGYQAITYGWLVGELVRRASGRPVEEFVREEIAGPLGLDGLFLRVPPDQRCRQVPLLFPRPERPRPSSRRRWPWTRRVLNRLIPAEAKAALAPRDIAAFIRSPRLFDAPIPSINGVFSARSLAAMYAALIDPVGPLGRPLVSSQRQEAMATVRNRRRDRVLGIPMFWRLGFHLVGTHRRVVRGAYGHFGYGGSGAWLDPRRRLALALVLNRVAGTPIGDGRILRVNAAALAAADT